MDGLFQPGQKDKTCMQSLCIIIKTGKFLDLDGYCLILCATIACLFGHIFTTSRRQKLTF